MEKKLKKIDTVLFDYDGTLVDTNDIILKSWQYTFERLGVEMPPDGVIYATYGELLVDTMWDFFGGDEQQVMDNVGLYREFQNEHFDGEVTVFPGAAELLDGLREDGYKLALVTSRTKLTTLSGLKRYGLEGKFDELVTSDDTDAHKPSPEPFFVAMEKLGSKPSECVMLGDTWMDVEGAWNAGVCPIMSGWSLAFKFNKGSSIGPRYTIQSLPELRTLLNRINEEQ